MPAPIVLVHGGGHGAWCWEPTVRYLEGNVLAVDLPPKSIRGGKRRFETPPEVRGLALGDFADSVLADVDAAGFPRFVLVGHSMGGLTISEVAQRAPDRVEHLVYVSCIVSPEGRSAIDALPENLQHTTRQAVEAFRDGDNSIRGLDDETSRFMFCNDMDEDQTRFVLDHIGAEAAQVLDEPTLRSAIPSELPKAFVKLLRDRSLAPDDQDVYIQNLRDCPGGDVEVITIDAGHDVMISEPEELADVLNRIAAAVG